MGVVVASLIGNESARLTGADVGTDEMQMGRTTEVQPRMTPGWLHRGGDEHLVCTVDDNNNNNNSTVNAHLDVPHCCSAMTNIAIRIRTASPAIESHTNTYCRAVYLVLIHVHRYVPWPSQSRPLWNSVSPVAIGVRLMPLRARNSKLAGSLTPPAEPPLGRQFAHTIVLKYPCL